MKKVRIIGVPMDLGGNRRGVDMGPSVIRVAGLHERLGDLGIAVEDSGNIEVRIAEEFDYGHEDRMYLEEISQACRRLADRVCRALSEDRLPLVLGGDHSIAAGSVAGTASFHRGRGERIGLIWIDAHTDLNTPESSPSGNVHGMPLAAILGLGPPELRDIHGFSPKVDAANAVVIGARSIDAGEKENIRRSGLRVVTMKELDMRGMPAVMEEAIARASNGTAGFHCTFDLDVVDPRFAPGVGTPVMGGITYRESHLAMEMVSDSQRLLSLEVVEVNPVLDEENSTGLLAVELICSALGKKIL
ncbi:MAG: arginase [Acidobacteria bacterium]|nr:MAG: arginase [Acidobacteriota bacterium]